ncbi:TetR/AcrR family transcriptional regulator [Kurthia massiliensis]|uniref:TetR/AcrR family transcriptional regulator n=1 Tax=Kurthia massiliensis TaxID=1033739 RepID=UPI00028871EA|nr:TetR/AcrR family transcriptional regulator [Kurthia massiliensis]
MSSPQGRTIGRPKKSSQDMPMQQKILWVATNEFMAHGYKAVSMDGIAAAGNVTKATIYYYYDSKAALFTETVVHLMSRVKTHTERMLADESYPFKERLINMLEAYANATASMDVNNFIREAMPSLSEAQKRAVHESEKFMHQAIIESFDREMKRGTIPTKNIDFVLHTFLALMNVGRYTDYDEKRLFPDTRQGAEDIVNFFWAGLFA